MATSIDDDVMKLIVHQGRQRACDAINQFGDPGHPWATIDNLDHFDFNYIARCLDRADRDANLKIEKRRRQKCFSDEMRNITDG